MSNGVRAAALVAILGAGVLYAGVGTAYPGGGTPISLGSNPIWSTGGVGTSDSPSPAVFALVTAPADQDVVITDFVSTHLSTACGLTYRFAVDSTTVAQFAARSDRGTVDVHLESGVRVPAGKSLMATVTGCSYQAFYFTASGYYAAP